MSATHANKKPAPTTINKIAAAQTNQSLGVQDTYITVCAQGDSLTLKFGPSGVGAADGDDWPLAAGEKESFYISKDTNYVSTAGSGALLWYVG